MKTELLAPAKNIETAMAAIDAGADAVYIGAFAFGARHNALNSLDDIRKLVEYAHKFYVKVMVTVNTIIKNEEISAVKKLINDLYNIGIDSIIVQDMAILKWAIDGDIPPISLHMSTQCDNRFESKINFFSNMGISRVVLARELSLKDIKNIIDKNPEIEIETFIHGALCVSYSGQCYMSQYIGGRSANRGECAQPCRKKYSVVDDKGNVLIKNKHVLSLKDFCAEKYLQELVNIGVKSFKIEGRLKDINYVKNVVGYYRRVLDKYSERTSSGETFLGFEPNIYKTFNRGYTTYFLNNRERCFNFDSPKFIGEMIGKVTEVGRNSFRLKLNQGIKLSVQDGLTFDKTGQRGCLINRLEKDIVYPNNMPEIESGMNVYRNVDIEFEKELNNAKITRKIGVKITYEDFVLKVIDEDKNESQLNITERELPNNEAKNRENFIKSIKKTGDEDFYIIEVCINSDIPFMPISRMNEYRRELFKNLMVKRLNNYKREVQTSLKYVQFPIKELDYRGNVSNNDAEKFYNNCGVTVNEYAPEIQTPQVDFEVMRTKHCIKYALNKCKSSDKLFLVDDRGKKFKLNFDCCNCEMGIIP